MMMMKQQQKQKLSRVPSCVCLPFLFNTTHSSSTYSYSPHHYRHNPYCCVKPSYTFHLNHHQTHTHTHTHSNIHIDISVHSTFVGSFVHFFLYSAAFLFQFLINTTHTQAYGYKMHTHAHIHIHHRRHDHNSFFLVQNEKKSLQNFHQQLKRKIKNLYFSFISFQKIL